MRQELDPEKQTIEFAQRTIGYRFEISMGVLKFLVIFGVIRQESSLQEAKPFQVMTAPFFDDEHLLLTIWIECHGRAKIYVEERL